MPRGDGTGPLGKGPMTGRGGRSGAGMRRSGGGGATTGPVGECVCPQCGEKTPHERGVPCFRQKCPKCGTAMVRA